MVNENNIVETIKKGKLRWVRHAMKSQNSLLRTMLEQSAIGKRPLGRPKLRWKHIVKRDVRELKGGVNWKDLKINRDDWSR
ncbi:Uncharacterized protein FWK35_00031676, partial [Aphis craccivora]